jgi:hypothetical protein
MGSEGEAHDGADEGVLAFEQGRGIGHMDGVHADRLEAERNGLRAKFFQFLPRGLGFQPGMVDHSRQLFLCDLHVNLLDV